MSAKFARPVTAFFLVLALSKQTEMKANPPAAEAQQQVYHAIVQNQIEALQTLLQQGSDPNARVAPGKEDAWMLQDRPNDDPAPPLLVTACRFGCLDSKAVGMLIAKGAKVNVADKNGVTPLMAASELDWDPSIALLLEHGAKTQAKDQNGKTALMYAMSNRGLGAAAKLLGKGADINDSDKAGRTPLMYAITQAARDTILLFGEDEVKKEKLAKERYLELVAFLIAQKADVNAKDAGGNTPLMLATAQRQPEIVQRLKRAGAK